MKKILTVCLILLFASLVFQQSASSSGRHPEGAMCPSADTGEEGNLQGAISATPPVAVFNEIVTTRYCPICGKTYTSTHTVCPTHGVALKYKYNKSNTVTNPVQASTIAPPAVLYCPVCGTQYTTEHSFCPKDGTKLEVIK